MIKKIKVEKPKLKLFHKFLLILLAILGLLYTLDYFFDRYTLQSPVKIEFQSPIRRRVVKDARLGNPRPSLNRTTPKGEKGGGQTFQNTRSNPSNFNSKSLSSEKDTSICLQNSKSPREAILRVFGNNKVAFAVAMAESRLNCKAVSKTNDYGLFQINKIHLWRFRKKGLDPFNCYHNALIAYEIYKERGWNAWSAFKNGSYRKFLSYKFK